MNKISVTRGDDITIDITFTDQDGVAVNLTNCKVYFTVKRDLNDEDDEDALIEVDWTSHATPLQGKTVLAITNEESDIDPGTYYYDLQLKDAAGKISSTQYGIFEVAPDVTRRINGE
jgi:hypothetical protein